MRDRSSGLVAKRVERKAPIVIKSWGVEVNGENNFVNVPAGSNQESCPSFPRLYPDRGV